MSTHGIVADVPTREEDGLVVHLGPLSAQTSDEVKERIVASVNALRYVTIAAVRKLRLSADQAVFCAVLSEDEILRHV